jgi:tetratricopeptide (TPR) repeat protein
MVSCFVSYTAADSSWAEWVADVLRKAGHRVTVQATDFLPGDNFVLRMQEASAESDHTIVILSDQFLGSRFGAAEWAAAFVQDPTGRQRKLIPVAVERVRPTGLWASIVRLEIFDLSEEAARAEILRALVPMQKPAPAFPGAKSATPRPALTTGPRVDVWRLASTPSHMVGRTAESEALTRAWLSGNDNVVSVVGWGGAGKTTLIANWLAEMAAYRYHGAENVFAWSFDGQFDGENWVTSDQFFDALIRFLDIEGVSSSTTWERCREATHRLQQSKSLIILDGLERIQHPPGALEGTFRERVMQMFIRELAALNTGMLVLASRLPIIDIDAYVGKTCRLVPVPELSRAESIEILTSGGIQGDLPQLSRIAAEVRDHPLSLRLLSGYLQTVFTGDARLWESSGLSKAVAGEGGNASAIMDQYAAWFDGKPELQLLQMLGLFNREATEEELAVLRERPVCTGLNDQFTEMNRADLAYTMSSLRRAGMIQINGDRDGAVDAHPLVREYFQRSFRKRSPDAFREGHRRLRNLLAAKSSSRPNSLEECAPVMAAIWHGTRAGDNTEALESLYRPRLAQDHHFLRDGLGAAASNHAVLSYLLEDTGSQPLSDEQVSSLLADQSLDLRMMGNTAEAIFPLQHAIRLTRSSNNPLALVNQLRHLSQLELALGKVDEACRHAEEALRLSIEQQPRSLETLSARTSCAHALLQSGRYNDARQVLSRADLFADEALAAFTPHASRVTSCIAIYRTVDTLLGLNEIGTRNVGSHHSGTNDLDMAIRALSIARSAVDASPTKPGLLGAALLELASERIADSAGLLEPTSPTRLARAVEDIRTVGQRPWIIEANLVQCRAMTLAGMYDQASSVLEVAERLAAGDGMVLQKLVCQIERLLVDTGQGPQHLDEVRVADITASAGRLGLTFLEDRITMLSRAPGLDHFPPTVL